MALIKEMFGLAVTLVPQGCMLPYEEDPVGACHRLEALPHLLPHAPLLYMQQAPHAHHAARGESAELHDAAAD